MLDLSTRLPGVLCETRLSNLGQRPLRLDVAGFIGLAERGPLDVPVMIEDFSQYQLIFGGDLPVARVEGRPVFAHLPRTVEAFFENGGQRCYVVRVAGEGSRANQFQIPGLLHDVGGNNWQPVIVPAAWHGRWSDLVSVATSMRIRPLEIRVEPGDLELTGAAINDDSFVLPLRLPVPNAVRPGDLLRLYVNQAGAESYQMYIRAETVTEEPTLAAIQLFGMPVVVSPSKGSGHIFRTDPAAVLTDSVAQLTPSGWVDLPFLAADYIWSKLADDAGYRLTMPLDSDVKIEAGTLLRVSGPAGLPITFFTAERVQRGRDPDAGNAVRMIIDSDDPLQLVTADLNPGLSYTVTQVDVLSFDLLIREGENTLENWPDLRYSPKVNYWADICQPGIGTDKVKTASFTVDDFTNRSLRLGSGREEAPLPLPIGMSAAAVTYFGPQTDPLTSSKDGLDGYDPVQLFIDEDFLTVGSRNLLAVANDLLHLAPEPRRLRGMHSLIPVEEVALITIPDLAHIGWERVGLPDFTEPETPGEEPEEPQGFHDCPAPLPEIDDDEAAPVIMLDPNTADTDPNSQAWLENLPEQWEAAEHDDAALLDVQRALIRLCAARADIVTLLSLPQHYNVQAAGQWQQELTSTPEFFDGNPLSYAAAYHGWLAVREETTPSLAPLRYLPPDGFVAGMIAAREILRGAWIAPANVALQRAADLQPNFKDEAWLALYQRQMNIVRRQPGRFALMSALTLSRDNQLRQLNVRRLLILLRKLALREGQRYVFETNNERFRALVQTYFENILNRILERGGLQAFQVVTNEEINTPNDYDNGRFLIALKVAPTLPIEFITITMLRSGNDALSILERTT